LLEEAKKKAENANLIFIFRLLAKKVPHYLMS